MSEDGSNKAEIPGRPAGIVVDRLLADVAGGLLLAMMFGTVASSLGRYLFSSPIPDLEAITEMLLVAVVFLPMAYTQCRREHIEVTLFTEKLSANATRTLIVLGWVVGIFAFSLLAFAMARGALNALHTGDAYLGVNQIVTWPARTIAVVGIAALIFRLCADLATRRYEAAVESAGNFEQLGSE